MTIHNSNQNIPVTGDNHFAQSAQIIPQNENISCLDGVNDRNKMLVEQIVYLTRMMTGYHQFVDDCFLTHPDLDDLSFSTEAIQLDIDKCLNSILKLATNH